MSHSKAEAREHPRSPIHPSWSSQGVCVWGGARLEGPRGLSRAPTPPIYGEGRRSQLGASGQRASAEVDVYLGAFIPPFKPLLLSLKCWEEAAGQVGAAVRAHGLIIATGHFSALASPDIQQTTRCPNVHSAKPSLQARQTY